MGLLTSPETVRHRVSRLMPDGFTYRTLYTLTPGQPAPLGLSYPPASPLCSPPGRACWTRPKTASDRLPLRDGRRTWWYRNINLLCIDYAFRPRLSSRLTLGGSAFPRNPWSFGGGVPPPRSLLIPAFALDHAPPHAHTAASLLRSTLPYPIPQKGNDVALAPCLTPLHLHAQDHSTSELLRTII